MIISDGSNKENFSKLKSKENKEIEVIQEKKYYPTDDIGKGIGMINGAIAAIKQGFENIGYIDGDIYNSNISKWFDFLFEPLERDIDIVRTSFLRNPADGQITRHITKPLIAMNLPEAWQIDQPLGGELSIKADVLKKIFNNGIKPPNGWGIDTFITMKTLIHGYKMGEVFLGQKMHGKKTLTNLQKMFIQCYTEAVRMIQYLEELKVKKKTHPIIKISSPFERNNTFDSSYMKIDEEVMRSIKTFKLIKPLNIPHDDIFLEIKKVDEFKDFIEKTKNINANIWVEHLYWMAKNYRPELMNQYYIRWKIRALTFCLHEIHTVEQAEEITIKQSKTATDFINKIISQKAYIDDDERKMYYYKKNEEIF